MTNFIDLNKQDKAVVLSKSIGYISFLIEAFTPTNRHFDRAEIWLYSFNPTIEHNCVTSTDMDKFLKAIFNQN